MSVSDFAELGRAPYDVGLTDINPTRARKDGSAETWSFGTPNESVCRGLLIISIVFAFSPRGVLVTLVSMSWSVVVFDSVVLLGFAWYSDEGGRMYDEPVMERRISSTDDESSTILLLP